MKKVLVFISVILIIGSMLVSCEHEHLWSSATCTTPKTCDTCGETEGSALEHSFGSWEETVTGDCFSIDTVKERTCKNCEYREKQIIPAAHDYSSGICTKCDKPIIDNITLPESFTRFKATLINDKHVSVYGVRWKEIVASKTPNTYHCTINFAAYQYDYSTIYYSNDYMDLKYAIIDSKNNIVLENTNRCLLPGGGVACATFYTSDTHYYKIEFDVTLDPNETYKLTLTILGGI